MADGTEHIITETSVPAGRKHARHFVCSACPATWEYGGKETDEEIARIHQRHIDHFKRQAEQGT